MCIGLALGTICCAGSTVCSCACSCCKSCCKTTFKQQVRLAYVILLLSCFLVSIFVMYGAKEMFSWMNDVFGHFIKCKQSEEFGEYACFGVSAVYRMSFSLMTMFIIIVCLLFTRGECAKGFNEGMWAGKIFFVVTVFVLSFFIPNSFFKGYVYFSQGVSILFLLVQSIILIDIFYLWGQNWASKYHDQIQNNQGDSFKYCLFTTFGILYAAVISMQVICFVYYKGTLNITINIVNSVMVVAITMVQLMGFNKYGSIITSGGVSLYTTFLVFSSQLSSTDKKGSPLANNDAAYFVSLSIGIILLVVLLMYLTFGSKQSNSNRVKVGQDDGVGNALLLDETELDYEDEDDDEEKKKMHQQNTQQMIKNEIAQHDKEKQEEEMRVQAYQNNQYIVFNIVMLIASIYGCMLITNWAQPDFYSDDFDYKAYVASDVSYWCKIISGWITCAVYIWTLIAPSIFPDRDFS